MRTQPSLNVTEGNRETTPAGRWYAPILFTARTLQKQAWNPGGVPAPFEARRRNECGATQRRGVPGTQTREGGPGPAWRKSPPRGWSPSAWRRCSPHSHTPLFTEARGEGVTAKLPETTVTNPLRMGVGHFGLLGSNVMAQGLPIQVVLSHSCPVIQLFAKTLVLTGTAFEILKMRQGKKGRLSLIQPLKRQYLPNTTKKRR